MKNSKYDYSVMILPFAIILGLSSLILVCPEVTGLVFDYLNYLTTDRLGFYYIIVGVGFVSVLIYLAFSKYGNIKLSDDPNAKPKFSNFSWGAMIFTSTMAADILYYSLHEWTFYYNSLPLGLESTTLAEKQILASSYPLFHWGITPWSFYLVPAVAYGYMFYHKRRTRQRLSEACKPILKDNSDKFLGKLIDVVAVVGLIAGTSTTFSVATPLLSKAISVVTGIPESNLFTIVILVVISVIYTLVVLTDFKGINQLAKICTMLFILLILVFLINSDVPYIIDTGITGVGYMMNNFIHMSTWIDTTSNFTQSYTIFYWAYWIVWCVANPFFIAKISEGRTIRNTLLGGLVAGLLGTFTSFIVFGNYGLHEQVIGRIDILGKLATVDPSTVIIEIINTLPNSSLVLVLLCLSMIAFYTSTFDAITLVMSSYSYKNLSIDDNPESKIKVYWSVMLIILPIGLLFSNSTMTQLKTLSIVFALPVSIILILVILSFFKELRKDWTIISCDNDYTVKDLE